MNWCVYICVCVHANEGPPVSLADLGEWGYKGGKALHA